MVHAMQKVVFQNLAQSQWLKPLIPIGFLFSSFRYHSSKNQPNKYTYNITSG